MLLFPTVWFRFWRKEQINIPGFEVFVAVFTFRLKNRLVGFDEFILAVPVMTTNRHVVIPFSLNSL